MAISQLQTLSLNGNIVVNDESIYVNSKTFLYSTCLGTLTYKTVDKLGKISYTQITVQKVATLTGTFYMDDKVMTDWLNDVLTASFKTLQLNASRKTVTDIERGSYISELGVSTAEEYGVCTPIDSRGRKGIPTMIYSLMTSPNKNLIYVTKGDLEKIVETFSSDTK